MWRAHSRETRPVLPEIERPRLFWALEARSHLPVRVLCGPAGSGKTTFLHQYVAAIPGARYLSARSGFSAFRLREALKANREAIVVLDDFDLVEPLVGAALVRAVAMGRLAPRRLIVAGRVRRLLHVRRFIASGIAALLDARDLAFDPEEARRLAQRLGLMLEREEIARLLHLTDGWALPLTWILRTAAAERAREDGFVERWAARQGGAFLEFVEENAFDDLEVRRTFMAAIDDPRGPPKTAWRSIEAGGGPVIRAEGELRPYRIIATLAGRS